MLTTEYIQRNIEFNDYPFAKKVLWINNVEDYSKVSNAAQKLIEEGVLTHFYKVDDVILCILISQLLKLRIHLQDPEQGCILVLPLRWP